MTLPPMKSQDQIQAAHDRLTAIITSEVPNPYPDDPEFVKLRIACDVLCWCLNHDHNTSFGDNLTLIDAFLELQGIGLRRIQ